MKNKYFIDLSDILFYTNFMALMIHFQKWGVVEFMFSTVTFFGIMMYHRLYYNKKGNSNG